MAFHSGFVCILGRPNAGKSTLLNTLVGEKIAIVTHKPQTTRNRIQGIVNVKARKGRPAGQIVLIDTPGVHAPDSPLNRKMMQEVEAALAGCDLLLVIVDATAKFGHGDEYVLHLVKRARIGAMLLLNKIDLLDKRALLPLMEHYSKLHGFREIFPVSALKGEGVEEVISAVVAALPEGPRYFPQDQITDQPGRFIAAELIREQLLKLTGEEVPYASTVLVERFEEEPKLTRIAATIFCEREGQKGIIIGRGGQMLKKIGTAARHQIERRLGGKVFLELFVKVRPHWREQRQFLETLDWKKQLEDLAGS
jgi:GTP-binding protein Era